MRAIGSRVRKLENRLGVGTASEVDRRLWERMVAGRRRVAEARGEPFVPRPFGSPISDEISGLSLVEILHRGHMVLDTKTIRRLFVRRELLRILLVDQRH